MVEKFNKGLYFCTDHSTFSFKTGMYFCLFICCLFNDAVDISEHIAQNCCMIVNNKFEMCWRKWSWPNLTYYPGCSLEWGKLQETSVKSVSWPRFISGSSQTQLKSIATWTNLLTAVNLWWRSVHGSPFLRDRHNCGWVTQLTLLLLQL
jgi:hypothetical protein